MRTVLIALSVAACAGLEQTWLSACLAQPPSREVRVARLIQRLGSASYDERDRANAELAKVARDSRVQLEQAALSDDPEIRLRATQLLEQLKLNDLWAPTPLDCRFASVPASQALDAISRQSGNRIFLGQPYGTFKDGPVVLERAGVPFWEAMDTICGQTGNQLRQSYDLSNPGVLMVAGDPGKNPTVYSGPIRAQITRSSRHFEEHLDYGDLGSDIEHSFRMSMQFMWADSFRLLACRAQPQLLEARTDNGDRLTATQSPEFGWKSLQAGARTFVIELPLHPPAASAQRLDVLKFKWGLIAVGEMTPIEITDLNSPTPHFHDDLELVVESIERREDSRYELVLIVNRDLIVPHPQDVLFHENEVKLLDEEGRAFRKQGQTNALTDRGVRLQLIYAPPEGTAAAPKTLRFSYPRLRDCRELEFEFRDVPLPQARPE